MNYISIACFFQWSINLLSNKMKYQSKTKWKYEYLAFYPLYFIKMNKKTLRDALQILKSQKLIPRYEIEIKKDDITWLKEYIVIFHAYNKKYSNFIHFSKNSRYNTSDVKNILYENYIKN